MPLEHDPVKAAANLKKHGVSFADAEGALFDPLALTIEDLRTVDEARFVTMGLGTCSRRLHLSQRRAAPDLGSSSDTPRAKDL